MNSADTIASVHETSARSDAAYTLSVDSPFIISEAGESTRKWPPTPGELVNLWDMLRFNAKDFVRLTTALDQVGRDLNQIEAEIDRVIANVPEAVAKELNLDVKQLPEDMRIRLCKDGAATGRKHVWELLSLLVNAIEPHCRNLALTSALNHIERMRQEFAKDHVDLNDVRNAFIGLSQRIEEQLCDQTFLFVPTEQAKYLSESPLVSRDVVDRFPETIADFVDAGWCLGVERSTAAVSHLMCVLEIGIRRIAKQLRIPKAHIDRKTWGEIFGVINPAISQLANGAKKDKLSDVMAHLNNVRIAWRNPTMHSRRRYNQAEAAAIFENVKTFMDSLAVNKI